MTRPTSLCKPAALVALLASVVLLAGCGSSPKPPAADNSGPRTNSSDGDAKTEQSASDDLPALPTLDDPQLNAMLQQIAPEYRRWLANPDGYLLVPAQSAPWPCAVPQAERDRLAGVPNPRDPKLLAAFAKQERASGLKRGTLKPPGVEKPQVFLLQGQCSKGKLQGHAVLLAEYVSVVKGADDETRIPVQVLSRLSVKDGKPVGQVFKATLQGAHQHSKPQPSGTQVQTASATFSLADSGPVPRGVSISYLRTESPKPGSGKYISLTQHVQVQVPVRADRWKQLTYHGPTKIAETNFKGEHMHGKSTQFAYEFKSPFSRDPVRVPASEACYDRGEPTKSTVCAAD